MTVPSRHFCDVAACVALCVGLGTFAAGYSWARNFLPEIGAVLLGYVVLASLARLWLTSSAALVLAVFLVPALLSAYLPRTTGERDGCLVSVLNFNMEQDPPDEAGAMKLISQVHPDILFGEKIYSADRVTEKLLSGSFRGYSSFQAPGAALILSRFPILRAYRSGEGAARTNAVDISVENRTIRLVNMYVSRPNKDARRYLADYADIRAEVRQDHKALILAGDGNATVYSREVAQLLKLVKDVWEERGSGLGATFPGPWRRLGLLGPWLRIDFIFHNDAFAAKSAWRLTDATGAGHYPVLAELILLGAGTTGQPCR